MWMCVFCEFLLLFSFCNKLLNDWLNGWMNVAWKKRTNCYWTECRYKKRVNDRVNQKKSKKWKKKNTTKNKQINKLKCSKLMNDSHCVFICVGSKNEIYPFSEKGFKRVSSICVCCIEKLIK